MNFWKQPFSASETKEEALIRLYTSSSFWDGFTGAHAAGYMDKLAETFGTTRMAVNKKLGYMRTKGIIGRKPPIQSAQPDVYKRSRVGNEWREDSTTDTACLDIVSNEFLKIEDALKKCNVDEEVWEIANFKRGVWTTPIAARTYEGKIITPQELVKNYYIRINFRRKKKKHIEIAWDVFVKNIPTFKYSDSIPHFTAPTGVALEIAPVDAHFAKLAWGIETLRVDYDLDIAIKNYLHVINQNLIWGSIFKPEKIFFIVGNDLMHSENYSGTTPSGHNILDVDTRLPRMIEAALEINVKAIYQCRAVAPTEIIWIPGNHDPTASLWLCHALKHHFKDDQYVTVDTSPAPRKARLWGDLLVGWTHTIIGRHAAWANELAQSFPKLWGKSKFREWHHGHKHKKNEIKSHPVMTHGGVLCRQLTALSPIDAWHFENLFTDAVPGGEAFLWSKDKGVFSNFIAWL